MSRPVEWTVVGRSSDPVPGDPVAVRTGGQAYRGVAESIAAVVASMRALDSGSSAGAESVAALLENRDEIVEQVAVAQTRYRKSGQALETYATSLDRAQGDADAALGRAKAAQSRMEQDERLAQYYWDMYYEALRSEDEDSANRYRQLARQYDDDVSEERGRIATERTNVDSAVADRDAAAQRAIAEIEEITSSDGLNDSWWDNWGSKIVTFITKVAEVVAMVAGIAGLLLCWVPGLGAALLAIAAVAGVVAAVGNTALALAGEKSWGDALLSIGFALLGCVGLGGLRGILGSIRGAGQFLGRGGGSAILGAARSGFPTLVTGARNALGSIRSVGSSIRQTLRNAGRRTPTPAKPTSPWTPADAGLELWKKVKIGADGVPEVRIDFRSDWTADQIAQAANKVNQVNARNPVVTSVDPVERAINVRRIWETITQTSINNSRIHVDHILDLQLGGRSVFDNLQLLDGSVNSSIGAQIRNAVEHAGLPTGTPVRLIN